MQKTPPKHLDIGKIRLPLPGLVSILHRISGLLLFVAIPWLIWLLEGSLASSAMYDAFSYFMSQLPVKLVSLLLLWAFLHHACAGIRFLFLDIHQGIELQMARNTAKAVMVVSLSIAVLIGVWLW